MADAMPPLTTIHVPKFQMGILAMQQLFKQVNRETEMPVRSLVYTSLVVRQSTAPPSTEG